jgi:hypothetical protein
MNADPADENTEPINMQEDQRASALIRVLNFQGRISRKALLRKLNLDD